MADLARGIREIEILTDYLNDIILKTGLAIERDNHGLWKKFFHHYDNKDWENILEALQAIHEQYPEAFETYHTQAMRDVADILSSEASAKARVMDTKPYKTKAWKAAMAIREIVNSLNDVSIPNGPQH